MKRTETPNPSIQQADIVFDHFVASVQDGSHCMRLAPQPSPTTAIYMNECGDWWIEPVELWEPIDFQPWEMVPGERMEGEPFDENPTNWFREMPWRADA